MPTTTNRRARGVTLIELLVVLMILSIVLTAAIKTWDVTLERGRAQTTTTKLDQLVKVIVGDPDYIVAGHRADFGYVGDEGNVPDHLSALTTAPYPDDSVWRGPYLRSTFSQSADGYRMDGWGDTIIYGREKYNSTDSLFVRSYGGRGVADPSRWQTVYFPYTYQALTQNKVTGRIVDVRGDPVPATRANIVLYLKLWLYTPSGGKNTVQEQSGAQVADNFTFNAVPQGTHRLVAMYIDVFKSPVETLKVTQDVPVYPNSGALDVTLRIPGDWADLP